MYGGHKITKVRDLGTTCAGCGLRDVQEKEWMGCLLEDLGAFGVNGQWISQLQIRTNGTKQQGPRRVFFGMK